MAFVFRNPVARKEWNVFAAIRTGYFLNPDEVFNRNIFIAIDRAVGFVETSNVLFERREEFTSSFLISRNIEMLDFLPDNPR
ncbi:hypothetical protein ACFSYD_07900 [Paracoccus aerius]